MVTVYLLELGGDAHSTCGGRGRGYPASAPIRLTCSLRIEAGVAHIQVVSYFKDKSVFCWDVFFL